MFKSAITRAFYLGIMFLANLLLANLLLPYHFGTLTLMVLNASVFSIFTGLGTDSIILHSLVNKKWSTGQALSFTRNALSIQVALFVLFEVGSIFYFKRTFLSQNEITFLLPETAFFLGLILTDKLVILFYSHQKAMFANCVLLFSGAIYFTLLFCFEYYNLVAPSNLILLFSMQSLFQGLLLLCVYYFINKEPFEKVGLTSVIDAFKLSLIVMFTNVIQFFAYRVDYYFLERYYSDYEIGVFAQSNKMANLMWIIPNIFALLLIPKFSQLSENQYNDIFKLAFIKNILLAAITLIAGYIAFVFILRSEYSSGLIAFYYMLPGYFCWATVIYFGAYFSYAGRFHYNLIASAFCFITILIADIILIPNYGIKGAAISNSIAYSATFLLYILLYIKNNKIALSSFFDFRRTNFRLLIKMLK